VKKLHLFVIKSYIGPFIATFFIAEFILLMQFLWLYIDDLVGKGLSLFVLIKLFAYIGAGLVHMAMPIAVLLSSIMTFGNMGEHYELTAIKSAGISLIRTMVPLIAINLIISLGSFGFYNNIMPYTNLKAKSLLFDIKKQRLDINIRKSIFYNGIDNYSIKVADKNLKTGMLYDMMIYNHTALKGNVELTRADSGFLKMTKDKRYLMINLFHGVKYEELPEDNPRKKNRTYPAQKEYFDEETLVFKINGFGLQRTDEDIYKDHFEMMDIAQIRSSVDSLKINLKNDKNTLVNNLNNNNFFKKETKNDSLRNLIDYSNLKSIDLDSLYNKRNKKEKIRIMNMATNFARSTKTYLQNSQENINLKNKWVIKHYVEWNKRMSIPVACFILFFIGAPMGAIIRKGGLGWPVIVSIFFFLLYYVISIISEKSVKEGLLPAWQGIWISSLVLLPIGIFLTYKANSDSALFDATKYTEIFKKIFDRFFKKKNINNP
jgi:lipopolysaccharide export system permease protein